MAKASKKQVRDRNQRPAPHNDNTVTPITKARRKAATGGGVTFEYLTKAQSNYGQMIDSSTCTFGLGPAGTGKSYVAASHACKMLDNGTIGRIIVTRPAVEADGGMGFLPGEIDEKFEPYFRPIRQILDAHFGPSHVDNLIRNGKIEIQPLAYIRGLTFDNAFVILDEAQNTTPREMKTFLTRLGKYSYLVVNGDIDQVDIKGPSGLVDAVTRLEDMTGVSVMRFDENDIVRSGFVRDVLKRYRSEELKV